MVLYFKFEKVACATHAETLKESINETVFSQERLKVTGLI